MGKNKRV
jgi:hypothetical protein